MQQAGNINSSLLQEKLLEYFGFSEFRAHQEEIITAIIQKKNVLGVLPTSAGKSLCYQLPALLAEKFSIVISPLIALMKDQVDNLNKSEEYAGFINSAMDFREIERVFAKIQDGSIKLLYVAPERLSNLPFAERIKILRPEYLFIDEAHCISEWGHNFRPSYRKIKEFIDYTGIKNISAFTATATPEVVQDIIKEVPLRDPEKFIKGFERKNLEIAIYKDAHKRGKLLEIMRNHETPAIIYTSSRKTAEEINEFLGLNGYKCNYYHAGQDPIMRKHVQNAFIEGRTPIIVATNAFGMGIDKKDIRMVLHYNMPGSIENYYQEIGRAGRDGKMSKAVLLYERKDEEIHRYFISTSYPQKEFIKQLYDAICDYGKVAVGNIAHEEILLNYDYLRAALKVDTLAKALVHAAIRILEDAGQLRLVSDLSKKVSIRFSVGSNTLKNFIKTTSDHLKKLALLQILRLYGGRPFDERTFISFAELASSCDISERETDRLLTEIADAGLITYQKPSLGNDAVVMIAPRVSAERLPIAYKKINETFLHAHKKLSEMTNFVFSADCRFKSILNYFGEERTDYRCGICDNCTSKTLSSDDTTHYIEEILLHALYGFEEGLKPENLTHLVRGSSKSENYRKSPVYGVLKPYLPGEIAMVIQGLIGKSLIKNSYKQNKKLMITNSGIEFLKAQGLIEEKKVGIDYEQNLELFHLLKETRAKASSRFNQPAYLICPDEVLREIVTKKPDTKYSLMLVPGFNERMYNKFGLEILKTLEEFSLLYAKDGKRENRSQELSGDLEPVLAKVRDGYTMLEIAKLLEQPEAITAMQVETIIEFVQGVDFSRLVPAELVTGIKPYYKRGIREMKEIKKLLQDNYSFPEIRVAIALIKTGIL